MKFGYVGFWKSMDAAVTLLDGLKGHHTLRELGVWSDRVPSTEVHVAGAALARAAVS